MLEIYSIVVGLILFMTLPYATKVTAYSYSPTQKRPYFALQGYSKGTRAMTYMMFAFIFLMMVLICINKPEDTTDNMMYMRMYDNGGDSLYGKKDMEPTFGLICQLSPTFHYLLLTYALLSVGTHLFGIVRNSPNLWLSMLIYLCDTYILHDIIQIRAAVAAGLILISIRYIAERKWFIYFALITVATLFHYSAIIFVPLYFLPKKKMYKWFWIGMLGVSVILALFDIQLGKLSRYIPLGIVDYYMGVYLGRVKVDVVGLSPMRIVISGILMILVYNIDKIQKHYPYAIPCLCISILSEVIRLLTGDLPVFQNRIGELLGIVNIFTFAMIPYLSKKNYYMLYIIPILLVIIQMIPRIELIRYI